jgi:hypothetical protein
LFEEGDAFGGIIPAFVILEKFVEFVEFGLELFFDGGRWSEQASEKETGDHGDAEACTNGAQQARCHGEVGLVCKNDHCDPYCQSKIEQGSSVVGHYGFLYIFV